MSPTFDFVVVGGASSGAIIAARLSEDSACRVLLIEAGDRPPEVELMPVAYSHDAQIACFPCGYTRELWHSILNVDTAQYFDDTSERLAAEARSILVLANPVLPHSEGEIVLESADPAVHPAIRMNNFADPHDMKVMVAVLRRALDIVAHWPARQDIGRWLVPPFLAAKHGFEERTAPAMHFWRISHCTSQSPCTTRPRRAGSAALSIHGSGSRVWANCAWRMPASCPTWSAAIPTRRA